MVTLKYVFRASQRKHEKNREREKKREQLHRACFGIYLRLK